MRALRSALFAVLLFVGPASAAQAVQALENRGQWPNEVKFRTELNGAVLWFEERSVVMDLFDANAAASAHGNIAVRPRGTIDRHAVRLRFLSATQNSSCTADSLRPGIHHFLLGDRPEHHARDVRAFARIRYSNVAPGCDAVFHTDRAAAKYDLLVHPGADPEAIRFTYEGADEISIRGASLVVNTSLGRITEHIPIAYQTIAGEHVPVRCAYIQRKDGIGFSLGQYDRSLPLVIDPTLAFATYSGSFSNNFGYTATFDRAGFLYAGSTAFGNQYPVTLGAYQAAFAGGIGQGNNGGTDIVITKYDTTGSFLVWSTYLGGARDEMPHSLIVDDNDELLVLGTTGSSNFPMAPSAYDNTFAGGAAITPSGLGVSFPTGTDMVVARLSSTGGALLGSTYLGGAANDGLNTAPGLRFNYADEVRGEVLLDAQGRVWVVSCTQSTNAPVTADALFASFQGGAQDGYVARFNAQLTELQFASYIGGSAADACYNGAFDGSGSLFITGGTASSDLPSSTDAAQPLIAGGPADAFAARISTAPFTLDALSYWGSTGYDQSYFVECDTEGNVFLFGQTNAPSGALIVDANYQIPSGGQFITKLNNDLSTVLLSTRTGRGDGDPDISPTAFLVDVCNKIYTSGWGSSPGLGGNLTTQGLPVTADAHQTITDGNDLYLAVFDIDMSALIYATYYGGGLSPEHVDGGTSRFDRRGRVYQSVCAGCQNNDDFPTSPGAWSATNNSAGCNNGVLKFDFDAPLVIAAFQAADTVCAPGSVALINQSSGAASYAWDFGDGSTSTASTPEHTYAVPGTYTIRLIARNDNACNLADTAFREVTILPQAPPVTAMNDTLICGPIAAFDLIAASNGTASFWQWSTSHAFSDVLNSSPADSTATIAPAVSGTYYVRVGNGPVCRAIDSVQVIVSLGNIAVVGGGGICTGDTITLSVLGADAGSTFSWEPADEVITGAGTANIRVAPTNAITFGVSVVAPSGCAWSGEASITVSPIVATTVQASGDPLLILPGGTTQLNALPIGPGITYNWSPFGPLNNSSIPNPIATLQETTLFTATITDGVCTKSDTVLIKVHELVCGFPDIFVPNTFTPNADGTNDLLFVRGNNIQRLEFLVFDRSRDCRSTRPCSSITSPWIAVMVSTTSPKATCP
ncbi:MAG: PKD domain-containing protein [Flavobacteriales bacterium]|nr:PKD domain-containing protein [Flavobacteriales bacterium]